VAFFPSTIENSLSLSRERSKGRDIKGRERGTYPTTSCASLAASGSVFFAIFPAPPRPVVKMSDLRVGVSRVMGSRSEGVEPMLPESFISYWIAHVCFPISLRVLLALW
jgi:hypothetical protein